MSHERDARADDLFVDHCLTEEFGGRRSPDYVARLKSMDAAAAATAAARVDAATAASTRSIAIRTSLLAAALVALAVGAWLASTDAAYPLRGGRATRDQALLDAFHRAMPRDPAALHDQQVRQRIAPRALPVLRDILTFHREHPDEQTFGLRIVEFDCYAAMLGDAEVLRSLADRAAADDAGALAQLALVRLVTMTDARDRVTALAELGGHLRSRPDIAGSVVRCLRAAELGIDEAERVAGLLEDPELASYLRLEAEMALASPRQLRNRPLELAGRLVDDRNFSTASLRGHVVLVFFWASWCQPSVDALAEIERVRERNRDLRVVGVSCDHDFVALRDFLAAHPAVEWPQMFDRGRPGWHEFAFHCRVRSLPLMLLLDRDGIVREVDVAWDLDDAVRRVLAR